MIFLSFTGLEIVVKCIMMCFIIFSECDGILMEYFLYVSDAIMHSSTFVALAVLCTVLVAVYADPEANPSDGTPPKCTANLQKVIRYQIIDTVIKHNHALQ